MNVAVNSLGSFPDVFDGYHVLMASRFSVPQDTVAVSMFVLAWDFDSVPTNPFSV